MDQAGGLIKGEPPPSAGQSFLLFDFALVARSILAGHATLYRSSLSARGQVDRCAAGGLEVIVWNRISHVDHEAQANEQCCECHHCIATVTGDCS